MLSKEELSAWLDAAQEAARRGAAVLNHWRHRFQVREKGRFDLVTEADLGSQKAIKDYLHERFPEHGFLGEESDSHQRPGADAPPTWIVDPLDGTTNYVHDCPLYCVSVGLLVGGELVVGAVLDPTRDELFSAACGMGAWLGARGALAPARSRRLRTSGVDRLEQALLATGFPPDMRGQEQSLAWWRYFSLRTHSLRRTGTTALNLAYLAAGRFDGYWGFDNHVWDVAAATVLVREAGGLVSNVDGSDYDPFTPDALASNGPLHPVLLEHLRRGPADGA